ncbi:MAG: OB-fold domain-containing protein [Deltaproteobacteria bacterium]|nr:OB-fold domain-containing protein [Deltaproteobacteria bacterium]
MPGICSYGGYVPRFRLNRMLVYQAMGWMNPGNIANAKGEKAVANFDEDSITMAVAAGLNALDGIDRSRVQGVFLASTTMPYKERLNAGIVATAIGLGDNIRTADFSGGLKAGTSALLSAIDSVEAGRMDNVVVTAAESRLGKPASPQELIFGDAAAAFVVGNDPVIAEFKGSFSLSYDFTDHYRGKDATFDRQWEDRWIRDLGFGQFIPQAVKGLLEKLNMKIEDFSKVIYDCHYAAARKKLNKVLGISAEADQSNFQVEIGQSGTAQSMVMLAGALETAKPGDKLLVVSFGSGCDALCFEATDGITDYQCGMRAEEDVWTLWSAMWRSRKMVLGLWGSRCKKCGTPQLPPQAVCVNASCGAVGEMEDYRFAEKIGKVASFTGDMLAASLNPPAIYGQVEFDGGGKMMFDFTDCNLDELETGMAVRLSFRRKYYDAKRDISGYFWKAIPAKGVN